MIIIMMSMILNTGLALLHSSIATRTLVTVRTLLQPRHIKPFVTLEDIFNRCRPHPSPT